MNSTATEEPVLPRLLTTQQASEYLNIPAYTLESWRYRRRGPPFVRTNHAHPRTGVVPRGNIIRYRREDLDAWIESNVEVPK